MHRYIDALFTDDFGRQSKLTTASANGFARKKLDAASQSLQLRTERQEEQARRIEIREWRAAERSVAAEMRESDHRIRMMWRSLKTKVRPEKKVRHTPPKERKRHWPYASVALPKYDGPVIDRNRERGVFMRVRYYSRRTAEAGVSQRVALYCFNGAELDPDGNPYVATNIGATIDEALCGFDHLEQVNWAAAKNAKLLMHGILAVDHRQSPDEMMTCGLRWAEETLGRFDLPYLVTLHAPPPDGDQRNWHLHVLWSYRPMVRTGDHKWQVAEMLRTDLDNPAAMTLYRQMFAAVMTDVSFEAGQNQVWTAKSNADRSLPHEPQVHLGGAKTNQARSGEFVAENEENHERVMRSKAAVIDDALRHADAALAKAQDAARAVAARFARMPALPLPVPERIVAATMALEVRAFGELVPLSTAAIVVPTMPPPRMGAARIVGAIEPMQRRVSLRSSVEIITAAAPRAARRPTRVHIADLRIRPMPMAKPVVATPTAMPRISARTSAPAIPRLTKAPPLRLADVGFRIALPPIVARSIVPPLPATSWMRPIFADTGNIDRVVARTRDVWKRDNERRKREDEVIARAVQAVKATTDQEAAAQRRLLEAGEAAAEPRKNAWYLARARRERAMEWDEVERLDGNGIARPGLPIPRPGIAQPDAERLAITHRFPGIPGSSIGD